MADDAGEGGPAVDCVLCLKDATPDANGSTVRAPCKAGHDGFFHVACLDVSVCVGPLAGCVWWRMQGPAVNPHRPDAAACCVQPD
jgi:hypothetical protein